MAKPARVIQTVLQTLVFLALALLVIIMLLGFIVVEKHAKMIWIVCLVPAIKRRVHIVITMADLETNYIVMISLVNKIMIVSLTLVLMVFALSAPIRSGNSVMMHLVMPILIVLLVLVSILLVSNVLRELVQVVD